MRGRTNKIVLTGCAVIASCLVLFHMTFSSPGLPADVRGPHPAASLLRGHIDMLAGTIGERNVWRYDALERAGAYITAAFQSQGFQISEQQYVVSGRRVSNIAAALPGTTLSSEVVVLGAHYDSVIGCPGANDNATGVAALLELARRFAKHPRPRTIRFVGFVNEEPPFFQTTQMGSVVYASAARQRRDRIVAMLSLETMGYYSEAPKSQQYPPPMQLLYPDTGNFIGFVSNIGSARLLRTARRAFKARTQFPLQAAAVPAAVPGVGWSDHWAFWQQGYPGMMVTDTAPYRYPWYHSPEDTPDKVSADRLAHVVDGLEHVVHMLAGGER
jgi:Zn-dependent M28 family amino/carboxypeptidase